MQFENISIHCENRHIVDSCEITATVAPSAGWSCNAPNSADPLCYVLCILFIYAYLWLMLLFAWLF